MVLTAEPEFPDRCLASLGPADVQLLELSNSGFQMLLLVVATAAAVGRETAGRRLEVNGDRRQPCRIG